MKTVDKRPPPWPEEGLESVPRCPVCGGGDRKLLHAGLTDRVFRVAPGEWTLRGCAGCGSAYLDPRPTRAAIHLAYAGYYTHQGAAGKAEYGSLSRVRRLRRRLANGYVNRRYAAGIEPYNRLGVPVARFLPGFRKALDLEYRHLPRLPEGGGSLLDVGCGNGAFLRLAAACGWRVVGLEPDRVAVDRARQAGLTVHRGGIEYFEGAIELFDVITLNHVIEHVHDPVDVLRRCRSLLKPGGRLWLETPNIGGFGYARFGAYWRDLDPPRHLVLFNRRSLQRALIGAGFLPPVVLARPSACSGAFAGSFAMTLGRSPYETSPPPRRIRLQASVARVAEALFPGRREVLTLAAQRAA